MVVFLYNYSVNHVHHLLDRQLVALPLLVALPDSLILKHVSIHPQPGLHRGTFKISVQSLDQLLVVVLALIMVLFLLFCYSFRLSQNVLSDDAGDDTILLHRLHVKRPRLELLDVDLVIELLRGECEGPFSFGIVFSSF